MFSQTEPSSIVEAPKCQVENKHREEWLKYKGMDTFDAMKLYIEKVQELALIHSESTPEEKTGNAAD